LNFEQFSRFIINVVASGPEKVTFNDLADFITRSACVGNEMTTEKLAERFAMQQSMKYIMDFSRATPAEVDKLSASQCGRVNKLFDMWDLDGDGYIDFHELALGLR
jgi:Ca2+-binding EF-hand superfamily protein